MLAIYARIAANILYWVSSVWGSLYFKMAISKAVVSRVRVLAITHILVGALLIVFGIADGVTQKKDLLNSVFGFIGIGTGTWVSFHCRNSAFLFLAFEAVLFSRRPTGLLVPVKIDVETSLNHNINRFQFSCLDAFGRVLLKSGLECQGRFSYSIKCKCL